MTLKSFNVIQNALRKCKPQEGQELEDWKQACEEFDFMVSSHLEPDVISEQESSSLSS